MLFIHEANQENLQWRYHFGSSNCFLGKTSVRCILNIPKLPKSRCTASNMCICMYAESNPPLTQIYPYITQIFYEQIRNNIYATMGMVCILFSYSQKTVCGYYFCLNCAVSSSLYSKWVFVSFLTTKWTYRTIFVHFSVGFCPFLWISILSILWFRAPNPKRVEARFFVSMTI